MNTNQTARTCAFCTQQNLKFLPRLLSKSPFLQANKYGPLQGIALQIAYWRGLRAML